MFGVQWVRLKLRLACRRILLVFCGYKRIVNRESISEPRIAAHTKRAIPHVRARQSRQAVLTHFSPAVALVRETRNQQNITHRSFGSPQKGHEMVVRVSSYRFNQRSPILPHFTPEQIYRSLVSSAHLAHELRDLRTAW